VGVMQPYRYKIRKFLVISGTLALITHLAISRLAEINEQQLLWTGGAISAVITLFWLAFDKLLWRWKIFKILGISDIPDLNGVWTWEVDRLGELEPHSFTMVIFQTYTKISIQTNTGNSKGNSISAFFLVDETKKNFDLVNYWHCRTKKRDSEEDLMEDFKGISHIDIRGRGDDLEVEDYYFTDRNTPTQGKTILHRISKNPVLVKRFSNAKD